MAANLKRFIVVSVGNTGSHGYNERELPVLAKLVESHSPTHFTMTLTGALVYFRTTRMNLRRVQHLVAEAETLRTADIRFSQLKIGLSEGELLGDFNWLGRFRDNGVALLGHAIVEAVRQETSPGAYKDRLKLLAQNLALKSESAD
jgi:hypothetical protein